MFGNSLVFSQLINCDYKLADGFIAILHFTAGDLNNLSVVEL